MKSMRFALSPRSRRPGLATAAAFGLLLVSAVGCGAAPAPDEATVTSNLDVSRFQGYHMIPGGTFNDGAAVVTSDDGTVQVVGLGQDSPSSSQIYYNFSTNGSDWTGWAPISGHSFVTRPAMIVWEDSQSNDQLAVVGTDTNGLAYINVTGPGSGHGLFQGWNAIPGAQPSPSLPAAIAFADCFLVVVTAVPSQRYPDAFEYIWTKNDVTQGFSNSNWAPWAPVPGGGVFYSPPAMVHTSDGKLVIAGRGLDFRYWLTWGISFSWSGGWNPVSNVQFGTSPAISSRGSNSVDLFGVLKDSSDMRLWTVTVAADTGVPTSGFAPIADGTTNRPASAFSPNSSRIDVVVHGFNDDYLWLNRWQ